MTLENAELSNLFVWIELGLRELRSHNCPRVSHNKFKLNFGEVSMKNASEVETLGRNVVPLFKY